MSFKTGKGTGFETGSVYCEPFVGGGALLFALRPQCAVINDANDELIRVYKVIRDNVEGLIAALRVFKNDPECFYEVRGWDRDVGAYGSLPDTKKAARTVYLNKTCFNGLYRVNGSGQFNSPFGGYVNPKIADEATLRAMSSYLNSTGARLTCLDYSVAMRDLPKGAFVYLDPPYDPVSKTSSFTAYSKGGFSKEEQIRLRGCCDDLDARGISFMLSNSSTDFIRELYSAYDITTVQAGRSVNSDGQKRGKIDEVVVRNYGS